MPKDEDWEAKQTSRAKQISQAEEQLRKTQAESAVRTAVRNLLTGFNPDVRKAEVEKRIDELVRQYPGREAEMFAALREEFKDRVLHPPVHVIPLLEGAREHHLFPVYSVEDQVERLKPVLQHMLETTNPCLAVSPEAMTQLLEEHQGHEEDLFANISQQSCAKEENSLSDSSTSCDPSSPFRAPLIELINEFFPERVGEVNALLEKYSGREVQMFATLRNDAALSGHWQRKREADDARRAAVKRVAAATRAARAAKSHPKKQKLSPKKQAVPNDNRQAGGQAEHMEGLVIAFNHLDPSPNRRLSMQMKHAHAIRHERHEMARRGKKMARNRAALQQRAEEVERLMERKRRQGILAIETTAVRRIHMQVRSKKALRKGGRAGGRAGGREGGRRGGGEGGGGTSRNA
jgi:hypothetical protein